jgi:hypothetical protein
MQFTQSFSNRPDLAAASQQRPEMKGPQASSDIEKLLSGLKPKPPQENIQMNGSESVISVSSLKDLEGAPIPKKVRRRQNTSSKNTVALDI